MENRHKCNIDIPLPPYYIIEATNLCNFRCPICPNSIYESDKGIMDMNLFESILEQISASAKVIQLYWMGEPLIDESIYQKICMAKSMTQAKTIISTNGSMLTGENARKLRDSGLDEIIISVDACDSENVYAQIRTGGNLKNLIENIEKLLADCGNLKVFLQFIDLYINKGEKRGFLEKWKSCNIEISCLYSWANQIPALNLASDNLSPVRGKVRKPCADLWNKVAIHWNGVVSACCFDFSDTIHLGDCKAQSLYEIWNGKAAKKLRNEHLDGIYRAVCTECDAWAEPDEYEAMFHLE